jgi:hypothetical protein
MLHTPRPILPVVATLALLLAAPRATAQAPNPEGSGSSNSAVVLQTGSTRDLRELAQATGRLIRVEVDRSGVVQTQGTPALYLEDLQMALGCLGETPECLTVVAQELNVTRLVYATLTRSGARLLLTLVYFDGAEVHLVTRGVEAPAPDAAILDAVPPMVREVFGLAPLAVDPRAVAEAETRPTQTRDVGPVDDASEPAAPRDPHGVRMGAYISGGVAVASLVAGAVLLARRASAEDEYRNTPTDTAAGVDDALAARDRGLRLGNAAVGVLAVGGAAAVTSVLLGVLTRKRAGSQDEPPPVSASVIVGPGVVGLHLRGSL